MAKSIKVTPKTLKDKATTLRNYNKSFNQKVGNLKTLQQKLNSMWDGEANDSFNKDFQKDAKQLDAFYKAVEEYAKALDKIADNYEKTEERNRKLSEN